MLFDAGKTQVLFDTPYYIEVTSRPYDIAPDGRFLMVKSVSEPDEVEPPTINVVQNWHEELQRLVPVP